MSITIPMSIHSADEIGGRKSKHHILGQDRLVRIFTAFFDCEKEGELPTVDKTYFGDVVLTVKGCEVKICVLEVDTYIYGTQKKKSPKHIQNRDNAIMRKYHIPVIRIDVDALKEGRSITKFWESDQQIFNRVLDKNKSFMQDPEAYMKEAQRG